MNEFSDLARRLRMHSRAIDEQLPGHHPLRRRLHRLRERAVVAHAREYDVGFRNGIFD